jgi:NAD-dependent deacetylase
MQLGNFPGEFRIREKGAGPWLPRSNKARRRRSSAPRCTSALPRAGKMTSRPKCCPRCVGSLAATRKNQPVASNGARTGGSIDTAFANAMGSVMENQAAPLAAHLNAARRLVFFTGAGISTESGIPDFRSPGGIWSRMAPIPFQDFLGSEEMRREAWRRKMATDVPMRAAAPNRGHRAVAELVSRGLCACVITQNIDGLHQTSGVPQEKLVELHGNATYAVCLSCGMRHELAAIFAAFERDETLPLCASCGGIVKTATISFGQSMPVHAMASAGRESLACDLFVVLGSSLVVYPAAEFPRVAKRNGAKLIIINREPTDQDELADLVIHGDIGPLLGEAVGVK